MKQSKIAYYADLLVHPIIIAGVLTVEFELKDFESRLSLWSESQKYVFADFFFGARRFRKLREN